MFSMVRLSELRGTTVISREEGTHLGYVERVFIDPSTCRLSSITFRHSWLRPEMAVQADAIAGFGRDVLLIEREAKAAPISEGIHEKERALRELQGLWVARRDGNRVGTLVDLSIAAPDWHVAELHLAGGRVVSVKVDDLTVGHDVVLVPPAVADQLEETNGKWQAGLLGRILTDNALTMAVSSLSHSPASRAIMRATIGMPSPEGGEVEGTHRGRRVKGERASTSQPAP